MPAIKSYVHPIRLPESKLRHQYRDIESAFQKHDYMYVARYGVNVPELRGCALILLGNRIGGERVLDAHGIVTARSFYYRAFGCWRDGLRSEARRLISEGCAVGGENRRLGQLAALMERKSFNIVVHSDFGRADTVKAFQNIPEITTQITHHLKAEIKGHLNVGQPISDIISSKKPLDLIIVDDLKLFPAGLRQLGAPVVVNIHDPEWYYDYIEDLSSEIDLMTVSGSGETIEIGKRFSIPCTTFVYHFGLKLPKITGLRDLFESQSERNIDLVFTGGITHDFYRDKRQKVVGLSKLDDSLNIKIIEGYLDSGSYLNLMKNTKFTMNSWRLSNSISARPFDSLSQGALHLLEYDNGFPYIFSEMFHCFQVYTIDNVIDDIQAHLFNYNDILRSFTPQVSRLEEELSNLQPDSSEDHALRYIRQLMFLTHVESQDRCEAKKGDNKHSLRNTYFSELYLFSGSPEQAKIMGQVTHPPHWVRMALLKILPPSSGGMPEVFDTIQKGLLEFPLSLALRYSLALCLKVAGLLTEAEDAFRMVAYGDLQLMPLDPFPAPLDPLLGRYWIADAAIRSQCADDVIQLASSRAVWRAYALGHMADIAIGRAELAEGANALAEWAKSETLLQASLALAPHVEEIQRLYLRAVFALAQREIGNYQDIFLENFENAIKNDYTIFRDFAPMAMYVLMRQGKTGEAQKILGDLVRYLRRVHLNKNYYKLYPEVVRILKDCGILHFFEQD